MQPEPHLRRGRATIDLRGRRVLITGASSGIGEAAAVQFAAAGATVLAVARREALLNALVARIAARGGQAIALPADLSDLASVDALVERAGRVDVLVNNAGRSIRRPLLESLERWHDIERLTTLNYYAPLRLIRGLAPGMIERGDGHIINVASWRVLPEASPLFGGYIASKAALGVVSRVIETEWGDLGVHATTLYYPLVSTPMMAPTRAYDGVAALTADEAAAWMLDAARRRPVRVAPRMALAAKALDVVAPRLVNHLLRQRLIQPEPDLRRRVPVDVPAGGDSAPRNRRAGDTAPRDRRAADGTPHDRRRGD
ncbi:FabG-like 3-oxoacyl-(acyl-carrier-protein) reductase [Paraconexibacter sp. AEG42_29]|uniref:FabG-like 3-oxoacyl-(Acyl-carrier-protein) reductase n=1 Tax=Paraconexibacter sp. AEG42_29 TaxID=2997339 RepID=A0AAU7AUW3_9ACTN